MGIKNPRQENGADGYPVDNKAFRKAAQKVLDARASDLKQAEAFMVRLAAESAAETRRSR